MEEKLYITKLTTKMNSIKPIPNECEKYFNCDHGICTVQCCPSGLQFSKEDLTCILKDVCKQTNCCCFLESPWKGSCFSCNNSSTTVSTAQTTLTTPTSTAPRTTATPTSTHDETATSTTSPLTVASIVLNAVGFISTLGLMFLIFQKFSKLFVLMAGNIENLEFGQSRVYEFLGRLLGAKKQLHNVTCLVSGKLFLNLIQGVSNLSITG